MDGYKIIDFGGITLENGEYSGEIDGIFDKIDISNKPIVLIGINGYKPAYVTLSKYQDGSDTYAYMGFLCLSIDGLQTINIAMDNTVDITIVN